MTKARADSPIIPALAYRKSTVARLIGVNPRTVERLISANKFPRPDAHAGRCPLWRPATLERWLEDGGRDKM